MADIAAANVTYTVLSRRVDSDSRKHNVVKIEFGDASLTHPAAGIPISLAKLGCPNKIDSLDIIAQNVASYRYQYDRVNNKLMAANVSVVSGLFVASTAAPAATSIEVEVVGY